MPRISSMEGVPRVGVQLFDILKTVLEVALFDTVTLPSISIFDVEEMLGIVPIPTVPVSRIEILGIVGVTLLNILNIPVCPGVIEGIFVIRQSVIPSVIPYPSMSCQCIRSILLVEHIIILFIYLYIIILIFQFKLARYVL